MMNNLNNIQSQRGLNAKNTAKSPNKSKMNLHTKNNTSKNLEVKTSKKDESMIDDHDFWKA